MFCAGLAAAALSPARAQCRLCPSPTVVPHRDEGAQPVAISIEAGLDFDRLILLGPGDGSATLRPDGSHQVSGLVEALGARAMVGRAEIRGEPGRAVRIELPRRIELHSLGGGRLVMHDIVSDLAAAPRLDSAGRLAFRFGGRLEVSGSAEGAYRGDVPITVDYL